MTKCIHLVCLFIRYILLIEIYKQIRGCLNESIRSFWICCRIITASVSLYILFPPPDRGQDQAEITYTAFTECCLLWFDFLQPEQKGNISLLLMWAGGQVVLQWHVLCLLEAVLMLLSSACRSMRLCCVGLSWWLFPALVAVLRCSVQAQHQRCRPMTLPGEIQ